MRLAEAAGRREPALTTAPLPLATAGRAGGQDHSRMIDGSILREGETCWRPEQAGRMAVIIDAEDYFAHVHDAIRQARHSIMLIGWDFDAHILLFRGPGDPTLLDALGRLLSHVAQASGSTLRQRLADWARTGVLRHVHSMLVGMLRGQPDLARDLIVDSCSVRSKRGGDLTGPNPTDRAKKGTKYHVAVDGDGLPVAYAAMAANVNDTVVFERLFRAAFAVMARVRTTCADKGYDAEANRELCRTHGTEPRIHKRGQSHGSGLGKRRWPVERSNAWLLENKRLGLRYDRLGFIVEALLQAACIFLVAPRLAREF